MSVKSSYSSSSFVQPKFRSYGVDAEPYIDADSYMDIGGAADAGYTPLLEKDYCTNFTCCGLTLADLHELVSHFEECHVTVVGPNGGLREPTGFPASLGMHVGSFPETQMGKGMGTYMGGIGMHMGEIGMSYSATSEEPCSAVTPPSSSNSTPSTAPSSSVNSPISPYSSPSPSSNHFPTLTSAFAPSETRECESAFASVTIAAEGYEYSSGLPKDYLHAQSRAHHGHNHSKEQHVLGLSFDALLHPSVYTTSASSESVVPELTMYATKPPSSFTSDSPRSLAFAKTDATADLLSSKPLSPTPVYACPPDLSVITDVPSAPMPNSDQDGRPADRGSNSKKRRHPPTKSQREKTHKCPRVGCTKSYLNLNGLKYHLEKGTCDYGHK